LRMAAHEGDAETLKAILRTSEGRACLDDPASELELGCVAGWTALHCAAARGHADCVHVILQNGAYEDARDRVRELTNSYCIFIVQSTL